LPRGRRRVVGPRLVGPRCLGGGRRLGRCDLHRLRRGGRLGGLRLVRRTGLRRWLGVDRHRPGWRGGRRGCGRGLACLLGHGRLVGGRSWGVLGRGLGAFLGGRLRRFLGRRLRNSLGSGLRFCVARRVDRRLDHWRECRLGRLGRGLIAVNARHRHVRRLRGARRCRNSTRCLHRCHVQTFILRASSAGTALPSATHPAPTIRCEGPFPGKSNHCDPASRAVDACGSL
jgi:hypothetical protein